MDGSAADDKSIPKGERSVTFHVWKGGKKFARVEFGCLLSPLVG